MTFKILEAMKTPAENFYFEDGWRTIVETCLPQLKWYGIIQEPIAPEHLQQYQGNFYGYLVECGVPPEWHWLYLRVNGMDHPREFASELRDPLNPPYYPVYITPSEELVSQLRAYYLNQRK